MGIDGKKIDAAFRSLGERRAAVGHNYSVEETPEQEAIRVQREMQAASATGDISTIMKLIASTSSLKPTDFIRKTVGSLLFMYYMYLDNLHVKPRDVQDMIDGLLYLEAKSYTEEQKRIKNETT